MSECQGEVRTYLETVAVYQEKAQPPGIRESKQVALCDGHVLERKLHERGRLRDYTEAGRKGTFIARRYVASSSQRAGSTCEDARGNKASTG